MKAYVVTTGILFAAIVGVHIERIFAEGPRFAKDPFFVVMTLLAAALCVWAWKLFRAMPRS